MPALIVVGFILFLLLMFAVLRLSDRKRENRGGWLDVISVILVSIVLAVIGVQILGFFFVTPEEQLNYPGGTGLFKLHVFAISFAISFAIGAVFFLPAPKSKLLNEATEPSSNWRILEKIGLLFVAVWLLVRAYGNMEVEAMREVGGSRFALAGLFYGYLAVVPAVIALICGMSERNSTKLRLVTVVPAIVELLTFFGPLAIMIGFG